MTDLRVLESTELAAVDRWIGARLEVHHRPTKVPYCTFAPHRKASTTDPKTWSTFAAAREALERGLLPLLGFVIGPPFVGVDLDHCRNAQTGVIEPWALEIIDLLDSYTEASLSGTGVPIIAKGTLPPGRRRNCSIEMYDSARFFVMTGAAL